MENQFSLNNKNNITYTHEHNTHVTKKNNAPHVSLEDCIMQKSLSQQSKIYFVEHFFMLHVSYILFNICGLLQM